LYRVTEGFGVLYVLILGTPSAMLGALLVNTFCLVYGIDVDPSPVKGSADAP